MSDFISRLQSKPKKTRKKIAFGTASVLTFFVFLFWIVSFSTSIPGREYADVSPLKNIRSNVAAIGSVFQEGIKSLGENFNASVRTNE